MTHKNYEVNSCYAFISEQNDKNIEREPDNSLRNSTYTTPSKSCIASLVSDMDVSSEQCHFFTLEDTGKVLRNVREIENSSLDCLTDDNHTSSEIIPEEGIADPYYGSDRCSPPKLVEVNPAINPQSSESIISNYRKEDLSEDLDQPTENVRCVSSHTDSIHRDEDIVSNHSRNVVHANSLEYNRPIETVQNCISSSVKSGNSATIERNSLGKMQFEQGYEHNVLKDIITDFKHCVENTCYSKNNTCEIKISMLLSPGTGGNNIQAKLGKSSMYCTIDMKHNSQSKEKINITSYRTEDIKFKNDMCQTKNVPNLTVSTVTHKDEIDLVSSPSKNSTYKILNDYSLRPKKSTHNLLLNDTRKENSSEFGEKLLAVDTESVTQLSESAKTSQVTQNTHSAQRCFNNVNAIIEKIRRMTSKKQVKTECDTNTAPSRDDSKRVTRSRSLNNQEMKFNSVQNPQEGGKVCTYSSREEFQENKNAENEVIHTRTRKQQKTQRKYRKRWPRQFLCHICGEIKKRNDILQRHISNHEEPFRCKECGRIFRDSVSLALHHYRKHNSNRRPVCSICGFEYDRKCTYNLHIKSHDRNTRLMCNVCEKTFQNNITLKCHLRLHSEERFECSICSKHFCSQYTLKTHIKKHENPPKFTCSKCNKEYTTKYNLFRHIRNCE